MGCSGSKAEDVEVNNDKAATNTLRENASKSIVRTLILGTGESGKSTFIKQLKIILDPTYDGKDGGTGYSSEDRQRFHNVIVSNVFQCITELGSGMASLKLKYSTSAVENDVKAYARGENNRITPDDVRKIKAIWADAGVQQAYLRRGEFPLIDCCQYFLSSIDRLGQGGYLPTNADIIQCRMKTAGILEYKYSIKGTEFVFIDVGGQRAERRKWIHSFEIVTSVIFLASLNDYDLRMVAETGRAENRMRDSITLFAYIVNHDSFTNKLVIVFLNKKDLFMEKFSRVDVDGHIPEYKDWRARTGQPKTPDSCLQFIEELYREKIKTKEGGDQKVMFHKTIATDTRAINAVFNDIRQELVVSSLRKAGML